MQHASDHFAVHWSNRNRSEIIENSCTGAQSVLSISLMAEEFIVTDLSRMFGGKTRAYQIWSDMGVIEPLSGTKLKGPGTAKLFDRRQAEIAGVVNAFHGLSRAPIGRLYELARLVEAHLDLERAAVEKARSGVEAIWLVVYLIDGDPNRMMIGLGLPTGNDPDENRATIINLTAVFADMRTR